MFAIQTITSDHKSSKEVIHSGHFMVSHFEAEEQDDEDELAVPVPEVKTTLDIPEKQPSPFTQVKIAQICGHNQQVAIDTSLAKLFQCMSLAYRQKLTSPKWNRFRGIRLRWKDKIRLNNVIWRCWHMQFIKKKSTPICQFASPLDVDTHNKPEAVVLEGKYWKRKLAAVTAEYKKWRMFYRNHLSGNTLKDTSDMLSDIDMLNWNSQSSESMHMMVDEDYMGLMSDTLFSTITNQPFVFPDSREIAKAGLADFIQPSLGPLQPNLDDYMDTFEPLHEFMSVKLPTVPEEHGNDPCKMFGWYYNDLYLSQTNTNMSQTSPHDFQSAIQHLATPLPTEKPAQDTRQTLTAPPPPPPPPPPPLPMPVYSDEILMQQTAAPVETFVQQQQQPPSYQSSVVSKGKQLKRIAPATSRMQSAYNKSLENVYQGYSVGAVVMNEMVGGICVVEDRQIRDQQQQSTSQHRDLQNFKLPQPSDSSHSSQGYKFQTSAPTNVKFTSQQEQQDKTRSMRNITHRGSRQRSRSTSKEPLKKPPLLSAISDPQLVPPNSSVLLTQLLTKNTDASSLFAQKPSLQTRDRLTRIRIKDENGSSLQPNVGTTLIIAAPVGASPTTDPLILNTARTPSSPILDTSSQQSLNSPTSSQGSLGSPNREGPQRDQRRVGHIHAEQKRRYNIKNGFDMIHSLIPHLHQNPNAKLSKAAMLQKGAEYIRQLRSERNQLKEEMDSLRQQIETLNTSISNCQSLLPATGAPVSRRRDSKMQEMFDDYVRNRTMSDNWKFWIFSLLFRPLLLSFSNFVSTSSLEDLYRSTMLWVEQHCTLVELRPVVLNSLKYLCKRTEILTEPERLPEEAREAAQSTDSQL